MNCAFLGADNGWCKIHNRRGIDCVRDVLKRVLQAPAACTAPDDTGPLNVASSISAALRNEAKAALGGNDG